MNIIVSCTGWSIAIFIVIHILHRNTILFDRHTVCPGNVRDESLLWLPLWLHQAQSGPIISNTFFRLHYILDMSLSALHSPTVVLSCYHETWLYKLLRENFKNTFCSNLFIFCYLIPSFVNRSSRTTQLLQTYLQGNISICMSAVCLSSCQTLYTTNIYC